MKKLLLIEDDKNLSRMYAKKFSNGGWNVTVCGDGAEGIQKSKENGFDVIVIDLMLPGISGIDTLEMIRSDARTVKIPVVIYTNFGDIYNREKCMSYGADEFVLKVDSTPEALCETIDKVTMLKEMEGLEEQSTINS